MNIFLDDLRHPPEGWVHVHNLQEVKELTTGVEINFYISVMSFDYNLGNPGERGIEVMKYLAELCVTNNSSRFWPKEVRYHTNDPRGESEMREFAEKFENEVLSSLS